MCLSSRSLPLFLLCALTATANAQSLLPGGPRAQRLPFDVGTVGPPESVVLGDFDGDGRSDAAVLQGGELGFVLGAAGFGYTLAAAAPGGGRVSAIASAGADVLFASVRGGTREGLWLLGASRDPGGAPIATEVAQLDRGWGAVDRLATFDNGNGIEVYGLETTTGSVRCGEWAAGRFAARPTIVPGFGSTDLRVAPWTNPAIADLFLTDGRTVRILDTTGKLLEARTTGGLVQSWAAGFDRVEGRGRLALVTSDAGTGSSFLEVVRSGLAADPVLNLGVAFPRVSMADLFGVGRTDLVAVNTNGPTGFVSLAGWGSGAASYGLSYPSSVPFLFSSPNYAGASVFADPACADLDGDGDVDAAFVDPSQGTLWVKPSDLVDEIAEAPSVVFIQPIYTHSSPGAQSFQFSYDEPASLAFTPDYIEVTLWQKVTVGGESVYAYRGGQLSSSGTNSWFDPATGLWHPATPTLSFTPTYSGPQATEADLVVALRLLSFDPATSTFTHFGVESFTAFHHTRTPDGMGGYSSGSAGGTNPLPHVGHWNSPVQELPPVPAPPPL
ncbi:MAG TPA: hypothetical protein ENJ09_07285 [Planctomycetes bacterium]|nr:hypothetical protein [Planctomycetota bacterium]